MRVLFSSVLLLINHCISAQSTCEIWQWTGTDSANKILAKTQKFDSRGLLIYERATGFLIKPLYYPDESESYYVYSDTVLMTMTIATPDKDSFRFENVYDSLGLLVHHNSYKRRYVLLDTVHTDMFTINTALTSPETDGKWVQDGSSTETYDRWGRRIRSEYRYGESDVHTYTYEYDESNRLVKFDYFRKEKPAYEEVCEYFDRGYRFTKTWYDDEGNVVRKPGKSDPLYMHVRTITFRLDAEGRIVEEKEEDRKGNLIDRTITSYNMQGKIVGEVFYDKKDKVAMTHVYSYK